jgi:hypothetical protein
VVNIVRNGAATTELGYFVFQISGTESHKCFSCPAALFPARYLDAHAQSLALVHVACPAAGRSASIWPPGARG